MNITEIYFNQYQGINGIDGFITQVVAFFFYMFVSLYIYNSLRYLQLDVLELLQKGCIISFCLAGSYSIFEIGAIYESNICINILNFLDGFFRSRSVESVYRVRSSSSEPSMFGMYSAVIFPWLMTAIYLYRKRVFYTFLFLYLIVLNYYSLSRTSYIILLIQLILCIYLFKDIMFKKHKFNYKKILGCFFVLLFLLLFCFDIKFSGEMNFIHIYSSIILSEGTSYNLSNIARYGSQVAALKIFCVTQYLVLDLGNMDFMQVIFTRNGLGKVQK